jgi:hypothetical protein
VAAIGIAVLVAVLAAVLISPVLGSRRDDSTLVAGGSGADRPLLFGASAGDRAAIERTESDLGRTLSGVRIFRRWGAELIDADARWAADGGRRLFLSVRARYPDGRLIRFRQVADARPGSPLHDDMVEQARQVREFGKPVYLTFNHEPDADPENGGAQAFIAAWRNWVTVLRNEGATNARFIWTTTGFGYGRTDERAAQLYWPGAGWTDLIGVDAYNSYQCKNPTGPWVSPADLLRPVLAFAAGQPDHPVMLMEWSSVEDPQNPNRKADWFRELAALLRQAEYRQVVGLLQWGGDVDFENGGPGCDYGYSSSEQARVALRELAADPQLSARRLPGEAR